MSVNCSQMNNEIKSITTKCFDEIYAMESINDFVKSLIVASGTNSKASEWVLILNKCIIC